MRPEPKAEGERWIEQAEEDLKWAKDLSERGGYHIACFLAQQVAEKALKAYLYSKGKEVVLGHSVSRLCEECGGYQQLFEEKGSEWGILDSYYIPTRYPNGVPDSIPARVFGKTAAREAVTLAEEVVRVVRALMLD